MSPGEKQARQRLAEAIGQRELAERRLAGVEDALRHARLNMDKAEQAMTAAKRKRAEDIELAAESLAGGVATLTRPKRASISVEALEDDIDIATKVYQKIELSMADVETEAATAAKAVKRAVSDTVAIAVGPLLAAALKARIDLAAQAGRLDAMKSALEFDRDGPYAALDNAMRADPAALVRLIAHDQTGEHRRTLSAIAKLATDANAPLPV